MRFYCPQAFLNLDFQCRDDVSELKHMVWDCKEHLLLHAEAVTVKLLEKSAHLGTPQDPAGDQQTTYHVA